MTTKNLARQTTVALLAVMIIAGGASAQEWQAVSFPGQGDITGISFVHPDTGYIVTNDGFVGRTDDGGKSWRTTQITTEAALEDVSFLNAQFGFVSGRAGALYRTVDGGRSWDNLSLPDTTPWLFEVQVLDDKHILIAGATRSPTVPYEGLLLRSDNGGASFDTLPPVGLGYKEFFYRPGGPVLLLTMGGLSQSDDLGKEWDTRLTIDGKPGRALSFAGRTGLIAGPRGMLAYSSDSGRTWRSNDRTGDPVFVAAQMIDENVGYIGGWPETILKTTDGGRNWSEEERDPKFTVLDFCLVGDRLYAVGSGGRIAFKKVK